MLTFLNRWDPWDGWAAAFRGPNKKLRIAILLRVHPDKHPEDESWKWGRFFSLLQPYTETLRGGTRRRSRHTKNKTGRKRRTQYKKRRL
jgi:hypothetical protein